MIYSISEAMCTIGLLFWSVLAVPNPSKCAGDCLQFSSLGKATQKLILNRVTPCAVDPSILSQLDICKFHKV